MPFTSLLRSLINATNAISKTTCRTLSVVAQASITSGE